MYKVGQRFDHLSVCGDTHEYILAQVSPKKMCLINLVDGNRWEEPVEVGDVNKIIQQEFDDIGGSSNFTVKAS